MKTYFGWMVLVGSLLLAGLPARAQHPASRADSLQQRLATAPPDTSRVLLLTRLAYELAEVDPVASARHARQALQLAHELHYVRGECQAYIRLGVGLRNTGDFPAAQQLLLRGLRLAENLHDQSTIATVYNALGRLNSEQRKFRPALEYFFRAKSMAEKTGNRALLTRVTGNIGEAYAQLGTLDSATTYLHAGYRLDLEQHDEVSEAGDLRSLGDIAARQGHPQQARQYYLHSLQRAQTVTYMLAAVYLGLAELARTAGHPDSVLYYGRRALAAGQQHHYPANVLDASEYLSRAYAARRDSAAAFRYLALANATRDSLYSQAKTIQMQTLDFSERVRQQELADQQAQAAARQRQNLLLAALLCAVPALVLLWRYGRLQRRSNEQLRELNEAVTQQKQELQTQRDQLDASLTGLRAAQAQLVQSEKMASLGELTAGIAHEIQNPLNFVNNFSEVSAELVEELVEEQQRPARDAGLEAELLSDVRQNLVKIHQHGQRAAGIVRGMLEHSRTSTGERQPTNLNKLAEEYLRLAYQGLRAKDKTFNAELRTDFDPALPRVSVVATELGRVLLNLLNNAFYAVHKRQQQSEAGYAPLVTLQTRRVGAQVEIRVADNGTGMPAEVQAKIFQPFFTTKPTGEGTGLGLSLSYDIISQGHGGTLAVASQPGQGTEFVITLPA
ncbi:ATP-binding protein [Hymenobacter sp. DH14]|uniref:histidine kinase n=1 Tax=Hymenobacter cyanobacteriorum TaxID=2926463 RepID=A0A9X1VIT4_9BACT|nr:ATP-binding protein [Hymenobacter cyanobacteriorum]MCI1189959.1 ATP-binding protein [Hymenobacter cyanobacteriorum]